MADGNKNVMNAEDQRKMMQSGKPGGRPPRGVKFKVEGGRDIFKRLLGYIFARYKVRLVFVAVFIVAGVLCSVQGTLFIRQLIDVYITPMVKTGSRDFGPLVRAMARVAVFYALGALSTFLQSYILI
ncbi:MAG: ABC transporter ATP-binding protein, partial [Lachnospiraceae bacterium]|nr:ABC transporter ATP-binding protein [Lachnospiraceae bacterium]